MNTHDMVPSLSIAELEKELRKVNNEIQMLADSGADQEEWSYLLDMASDIHDKIEQAYNA